MEMDEKALSTAVRDEVDKLVGDYKDQVEEIASDLKAFEETKSKQAKALNEVKEKLTALQTDRITSGEFEEFSQKIASDIALIQADISRHKRAEKIASARESMFGWKAFDPKSISVVYNDAGRAMNHLEQRAYHLFHAPVAYEGEEGRLLKQMRDLHDNVLFVHEAMKRSSAGTHNITRLKSWGILQQMVEYFDPELASAMKAMSSTGSGVGDEWVPTESSRELYDRYILEANVENYIPHWDMPSNPALWPIRTAHPTLYRASERTVDNPAQLTKSNMTTSKITFTTETFAVAVVASPEFIEDSIIAVVPALRESIAKGMAWGYESMLINGSVTATHEDTQAGYTSASAESYEDGLRYLAIDASQTFDTQSTTTGVGDATAAFAAKDVRYLRDLLPGGYGAKAQDLVYVTSLSPFLQMLSFTELAQPGVYGTWATWKTGDLPMFDGSPIVVTSQMVETLHTDGKWTAASSTNTHKAILCFNKTAFKIGQRRGITVSMSLDNLTQQWAFVGTMRKSFQAMDSQKAVSYGYNIE